jgi:DNA-binding transcriptional LysR family regulator
MNIDTLGLQAFLALADHGAFHRAAAALHISQTALTRRLQKLEASLGIALVERTTRSVSLTNVGREFLPRARRLIGELTSALSEIRESASSSRGDVCVACIPTVAVRFLPRVVREYSARLPQNRIRVLDHLSPAVTEAVQRRDAEFGINVAEVSHPDLVSTTLGRDPFVLVCRDDHPLARRRRASWRQLRGHPLIWTAPATANRSVLDLELAERDFELDFRYEVQRSSTALGIVAEGAGAAVVPRLAAQAGGNSRLRVLSLTDPEVSRTLVLSRRRAGALSPAAQTLFDLVRARFDALR